MKVKIGPHKQWFGPFQLADLLMKVGVSEDRCYDIGEWLSNTWVNTTTEWIHKKRERKVKVVIHDYDTINCDDTLAMIVLPLLKRYREKSSVATPFIPVEDNHLLPEHLRFTDPDYDQDVARWDWIISEIIWTFEQIQPDNDWSEQYHSGYLDLNFVQIKDTDLFEMVEGPKHTRKVDSAGVKKHQERITQGLTLFGRYFQKLWL